MTKQLNLWTNGILLGTWSLTQRGEHAFQYADAWAASPAARSISLSLPLTPDNAPRIGKQVLFFFDNLLPDNDDIRQRIMAKFGTDSTRPMDLLGAIGRDCAGALQFLSPGEIPGDVKTIRGTPLTPKGVEAEILASLSSSRGIAGMDSDAADFRISIAGAQEKTALLYHDKHWQRPLGSTPTTHILKLPLGLVGNMRADMRTSVENEWLCLQLFAELGLDVPESRILQFGEQKVLVVKRFDRAFMPEGWIARLPQEDFCQALGISGSQKYEADGGPGMSAILRILEHSSRAQQDKQAFLTACVLFWMLAATDGHGKNFSLFHERGGTYRLTPFYDILSAWPIVGNGVNKIHEKKLKMAMAIRSKSPHWRHWEIQPRHWDVMGNKHGITNAWDILATLAETIPAAIQRLQQRLPPTFPSALADAIFKGVLGCVSTLRHGLTHREQAEGDAFAFSVASRGTRSF
ncbi:MAG: type II toxin-antitoxin system HipA family toxin [Puniceicoccales bacterium]|jgi:serine/threonine-protein kinase HipA|nr:type II toxin-antitoxin system HipA family toxin [Puniceicoccales bacterium]